MEFENETDSIPTNDEEYEAQLFEFSSSDVVVMICRTLETTMTNIIESVSNKVTGFMNENDIEEAKNQFLNCYKQSLYNNVDELEGIVNKYINIKKEILLSQDECQMNQYTQQDEDKVMESYEKAKIRLKVLKEMKSRLESCLGRIVNKEGLLKILETRLLHAGDIESRLAQLNLNNLTEMEDICASLITQLEIKKN